MKEKLGTNPYKGTRDFYPEDMAVQRYIFDTWSQVAESFGYERYDASVLEPALLYKSKGAENEEIVNEQTYTFTDRGEREVTLRPEMTPTVARMVAAKRRELIFPVRWYSIPNLFRYERAQRGRLREHWQLNCDLFGIDDFAADIELIALAHAVLIAFGATEDMFEIRINDRGEVNTKLASLQITDVDKISAITRLNDRKRKITDREYRDALNEIVGDQEITDSIVSTFNTWNEENPVIAGLKELGIGNVVFDSYLARGFDYYTGTIFEVFDVSGENNRSLLGGGRYDNLTGLFGGDPIPGVGFGMGDVTMRDFLETHNLLTANITAPTLMVLPTDKSFNVVGEKIAQTFRNQGVSASVDLSTKKLGKKIAAAGEAFVEYALVLGEDEAKSNTYTVKNLTDGTEQSGTLEQLLLSFT